LSSVICLWFRVEFAPDIDLPPLFTKVQLRSPNVARRWIAELWDKSRRLVSRG
jgi:hypothetical protein